MTRWLAGSEGPQTLDAYSAKALSISRFKPAAPAEVSGIVSPSRVSAMNPLASVARSINKGSANEWCPPVDP